jgi:hypothetical protein
LGQQTDVWKQKIMIRRFFQRPVGVGSGLNVRMFGVRRVGHALKLFLNDKPFFIARCRVILDQLLHPNDPWLTRDSIEYLERFLRKDMHGFEFGSGRSTKWFARRVMRLVSVEDDRTWYQRVKKNLAGSNVDYRFAETTSGCMEYVNQLQSFPDETFDFIIIDGSCRDACIHAAATKVKRKGIVVLDNADEERDVSPLQEFACFSTSNGVWKTDIYVRLDDGALTESGVRDDGRLR